MQLSTVVGDGIEVKGLTDAFHTTNQMRAAAGGTDGGGGGGATAAAGWCALGSVKGSIGHANCAAGITGLIKTVLCAHHATLVDTAHFRELTPKIDLDPATR
jgi:acyl transferase domain-containing protein